MDKDFLNKIQASKEQINKLKASFEKKYKIKSDDMGEMSDMGGDSEDSSKECCCCEHCNQKDEYLYYLVSNLAWQIDYLSSNFYSYASTHSQGHLPPINGADKMEQALKKLGIDGDYNVVKPTIYASNKVERHGKLFDID